MQPQLKGDISHPGHITKILKRAAFIPILATSQRESKSQADQWVIPGGSVTPGGPGISRRGPGQICVLSKHTLVLSHSHLESWL